MLFQGCTTFGELQAAAPGISRTMLRTRLRMLEHHGVVARSPGPGGRGVRYGLTEAGLALRPVCQALGDWGQRWMDLTPAHFDPGIVLWSLCRDLEPVAMPERRTVVRVNVTDDEL